MGRAILQNIIDMPLDVYHEDDIVIENMIIYKVEKVGSDGRGCWKDSCDFLFEAITNQNLFDICLFHICSRNYFSVIIRLGKQDISIYISSMFANKQNSVTVRGYFDSSLIDFKLFKKNILKYKKKKVKRFDIMDL